MTEKKLNGKRVAILATDGFEQSELFEPKQALEEAGAEVFVVAPKEGSIRAWSKKDWGESCGVDMTLDIANPAEFDALVLPGGVMSPDTLRINDKAIEFIQGFTNSGKPIAAICHGPWTLIETGFVDGRTLTSWPSIKTDLINAGAQWVDRSVVVDNGLVTSRKPDDLADFNRKMIEEFCEGAHTPRPEDNTRIQDMGPV